MLAPIPPDVPVGSEFAVGQSPFQCKGNLYFGTQTFFDNEVPGGIKTLAQSMGDSPLAEFITQRFFPGNWYDCMCVPALIAYESRLLELPLKDYLVKRTNWQAERDMRGVYKMLFAVVNPGAAMKRLPKVFSQMFSFSDYDIEEVGPTERLATFRGWPRHLESWFRIVINTYASNVIEKAGGKNPRAELIHFEETGKKAGLLLETVKFRFSWE